MASLHLCENSDYLLQKNTVIFRTFAKKHGKILQNEFKKQY